MFPAASFSNVPNHLKWHCETIEGGCDVTGLIAGPIKPVRTHWNGEKTLPCLFAMTHGKLFCACTVRPMSGTTTGYTPIITRANDRIVVPASALVGYELQKLNPGKLVKLYRPKKRCAALRIELPTSDEQEQAWVRRMRPGCIHDIEEYLCHLWQIKALTEFFGFEYRPAVGRTGEVIDRSRGD